MLVSVKINNCLIYNSETEFSMQANRHYKRFPNNVASFKELGVLKTAVIFGPNNAGKTNFVNILAMIKRIFLNQDAHISKNLFNPNPLCELTVSFIEKGAEYLFSAKYDAEKENIFMKDLHRCTATDMETEKKRQCCFATALQKAISVKTQSLRR